MAGDEQSIIELRSRFYLSVAETLSLLHTAPGYDRRLAMIDIARIIAATMQLPLVWIGRRAPGQDRVQVLAAAGPDAGYADGLVLSADPDHPGGRGPIGIALRERRAVAVSVDAPEFAPWRTAAVSHQFRSCFAVASCTRDEGQLTLAAYAGDGNLLLTDELLDWAQRLADELSRFWDHQALVERNLRMSRYRDAQRSIQRALLDQPDPEGVYRTLAQALVDIAGAAAVEVHVDDESDDHLRRVALVGPLSDAMRHLPAVRRDDQGVRQVIPTLAFVRARREIRIRPGACADVSPAWHEPPLVKMGALGCWPILPPTAGDGPVRPRPAGVLVIVTREAEAFDEELCRLVDEIAESAGLALRQHQRRKALLEEQQRQTYLALHDALTGLPNRRALDMHLECALERAERSDHLVAAGMLDLDDLKPINDRYGHAVGDCILIEVGRRLRKALRETDYVARLGGDEFVLVFEGLRSDDELAGLLDHVWQALRQPLRVDGISFDVSASLGIALFPNHAAASGEQLLRRADQAMYQVKARKRIRDRWWSTPTMPLADADENHDGRGQSPYGEAARALLAPWSAAAESRLPQLVQGFFDESRAHEGVGRLLTVLTAHDGETIVRRLTRHLDMLLQPDLEADVHRQHAILAGRFHASAGLEEVWLLESIERLRELIAVHLGDISTRDRRPLSIVMQRLSLERQWQLESMRELQRERVALLARLNALAWSADGYLELIQGAVDMLAAHSEVVSCAVGRPDTSGELTYEAVGGAAFAEYLRALVRGEAAPIQVSAASAYGAGPSGRAWRTAEIQRCTHYGSDPAMVSWRDRTLLLGIVSSVAVPLCPLPRTPAAILTIYSSYVGGFQSEDQRAFISQLKTLLDLALARLAPPRPGAELLPFFVRERWRARISTDAVEMHFQPVVRLANGRVTEVEALARLRDDDGELLMPARFLPALADDDLVMLFRRGLDQATRLRASLSAHGRLLDVSVNAPAEALNDARYAQAAAEVLGQGHCPVDALLLEILESPIGAELSEPMAMAGMQALKALGVRLVEDDLGAGYSSLIRLRQWPFDRVKIDQAIVVQVSDDPLRTLRFIRQLVRLGHDLDLEVVVEGLETPGLIEAALYLGADLGQGYALARPMATDAVLAWLSDFRAPWRVDTPATALGALAGALLWEEQLAALPPSTALWRSHAEMVCAAGAYLHRTADIPAALVASHQAMHAAAVAGPLDPVYRHMREQFMDLLIVQVRAEELASR